MGHTTGRKPRNRMVNIIGYRFKRLKESVDGKMSFTDHWEPIYPIQPGWISTAAIMSCQDCGTTISSSGGPGHNCLCPTCYNKFKLVNFTEGNDPL